MRRMIVVLPLKKEETVGTKDECQFICRALFSETFHVEPVETGAIKNQNFEGMRRTSCLISRITFRREGSDSRDTEKKKALIPFARVEAAPLPSSSLDRDNHLLKAGTFLATSEVVKIQDHFKGNQDNSKNIEKLKYASSTTQKAYT
jgi:hypothetical protein